VGEAIVQRQGRLAAREELHVVGRDHRQLVLGNGDDAVVGAVDDGDRAPPEPLARDQPVAEPVVDLAGADPLLLEELDRPVLRRRHVEPVEEAAVDLGSLARVGAALEVVGGLDRPHDREPVGPCEREVALVLGRHRHDRPGAVTHEHVVGDVHRHRLVVERVDDVAAGEGAPPGQLLPGVGGLGTLDLGRQRGAATQLVDLRASVLRRQLVDKGVLGCDDGIGHPEAGVGPCREDAECHLRSTPVGCLDEQIELRSLGTADPVPLHHLHPIGPLETV
jgi:hypothetical protein